MPDSTTLKGRPRPVSGWHAGMRTVAGAAQSGRVQAARGGGRHAWDDVCFPFNFRRALPTAMAEAFRKHLIRLEIYHSERGQAALG